MQAVTRDATAAGGAASDCADNVREAFRQLFAAGATEQGRQQLQEQCRLCDALADDQAVKTLAYWAQVGDAAEMLRSSAGSLCAC